MARAYIQLYYSYTEQLQLLSPEQCGKLTIALLKYAQTGEIPDFPADSAVLMLFSSIRSQIDRDYARYEAKCKKNSENANQRWHSNEANASDNMRTDANCAKEKENEKKNKKEKNMEKEKENEIEFENAFSTFWEAYPKKACRPRAREAFAELNPDTDTLANILTALKWQKRLPAYSENDLQYCPLASTYLRERRWLDEPPVQASNDVAAPFFSLKLDANGNEVAIDD
ncbi:DUF6291 domain-containing protein [Agathobaculum hominis]